MITVPGAAGAIDGDGADHRGIGTEIGVGSGLGGTIIHQEFAIGGMADINGGGTAPGVGIAGEIGAGDGNIGQGGGAVESKSTSE